MFEEEIQFTPLKPLHFIWLVDCSGGMGEAGKMQAINHAIREAIPHMRETASQNSNVQMLVRAIRFSNGASWHVAQPTRVENFEWTDLAADGVVDLGAALSLVADELKNLPRRGLPPVLVLLTDGAPTDYFSKGMDELLKQPWGRRAIRLAIAIGGDAPIELLKEFVVNPDMTDEAKKEIQASRIRRADNPQQLVNLVRWAGTQVPSQVAGQWRTPGDLLAIPPPLPVIGEKATQPDPTWV